MVNQLDHQWHIDLLENLSDLGVCYHHDAMAINALTVPSALIKKLKSDLPKIAEIARKIVLSKYEESLRKVRLDYADIINSYQKNQRLPIIMRPDGIIVDGQLKIIEMNIDSAIGGVWEVDFIQNHLKCNPLLKDNSNTTFISSPKEAFIKFLNDFYQTLNTNTTLNLALVGYADFNQFYLDQAQDICQWIIESTPFKAYYHTSESLRSNGEYITDGIHSFDVIYRDGALVHSHKKTIPMLALIKQAKQTKTIVLSDPIDLLIEHKGIIADMYGLINNHGALDILSQAEIELITAYMPWTTYIHKNNVYFQDKYMSIEELLLNHQDCFVIKRTCSHAGESVYIGSEIDKRQWKNLINTALLDNNYTWIAQENLFSDRYEFKYRYSDGTINTQSQRYTFSPFVFGAELGSALIRIEQDSKNRVLGLPTNMNMGSSGMVVI